MLNADDLDDLYTRACGAMTELGEERTELFLARLTLLLMKQVGDRDRVIAAIEAARSDL